jgi:LuxR family maltose regulon positive regulatory protein
MRSRIVDWPHLVEQLGRNLIQNGGVTCPLTLVSAPAGYGKTTLVIEWVGKIGVPVAWLSLDESDNDPTRFLRYLLASLSQVNEGLGQARSETRRRTTD